MEAVTSSGTAAVTLPTATQILITLEFDAPRRLIYRAWTTPELIKRWWNAKRGEVTVADVDLRVGGTWRWVLVTDGDFEVAFHGEYRELIPNERIVSTEVYEGAPDAEAVKTITFTEEDGRTTLTILMHLKSQEHRDAIISSGMEAGMQDALDLLEQVAVSLLRQRSRITHHRDIVPGGAAFCLRLCGRVGLARGPPSRCQLGQDRKIVCQQHCCTSIEDDRRLERISLNVVEADGGRP